MLWSCCEAAAEGMKASSNVAHQNVPAVDMLEEPVPDEEEEEALDGKKGKKKRRRNS